MLTMFGGGGDRDCGGTSRRDFLRIGALGLGGMSLPSLLSLQAQAEASGHTLKDRSVVFLFLCGGASHIETFDPTMDAPVERRSQTGEVRTPLPGVTFGGTFPKMARRAKDLAVVRSYSPHGIMDHATAIREMFNAGNPTGASIGSIYARLRDQAITGRGMPTHVNLIADEVDPQYKEDAQRMRRGSRPEELGAAYAPFSPTGDGTIHDDMTLNIPLDRWQRRRGLLRDIDALQRRMEGSGAIDAMDTHQRQAVDLILGKAAKKAMDLSDEDPRVVERYDTSGWNVGWLKKRPSTLGTRLLMARRLCEAGAGFVTVGSAGWDNHANDKHPGVYDGMHLLGSPLDHAVSAFLEDVEQRGLKDKILLVLVSEFGRTPKLNDNAGRDHWPSLCPLVFAGGGLKTGGVVGESTRYAEEPRTEPVTMHQMLSTILDRVFDLGELRVQGGIPKQLKDILDRADPIRELV